MTFVDDGLAKMGISFVCMAFGLVILIPGIFLVVAEYKKNHQKSSCMQIIGVVLVIIGIVVGVGGSCSI